MQQDGFLLAREKARAEEELLRAEREAARPVRPFGVSRHVWAAAVAGRVLHDRSSRGGWVWSSELLSRERQEAAELGALVPSGDGCPAGASGRDVSEPQASEPRPQEVTTGALIPKTTECLIDWVSVTFRDKPVNHVLDLFSPEGAGWEEAPGGKFYKRSLRRGDVRVYWDGQTPGMGVHVEVSGKGCRQLEAEGCVDDWQLWLLTWASEGGRFSRLDVALDDRAGLVHLSEVEKCVRSGCVVSRFKSARCWEKVGLQDGRANGQTIYFGSPQSDSQVRIYDKASERGVEGHWTRVEMQVRGEMARLLAVQIAHNGMGVFPEVLLSYLDFKQAGDTENRRDRWQTAGWWLLFLDVLKKTPIGRDPVIRTLAKVERYLFRQVAPMFAAWVAGCLRLGQSAPEPRDLADLVGALMSEGASRWKPQHRRLALDVAGYHSG